MGMTQRLITDDLHYAAVKKLNSMSKNNRIAIRLRAIVSAKECGMKVVAKVFNVTTNTLRLWVKNFKDGGDENLEYKPGRGRKSNLTKENYNTLSNWLKVDCNLTLNKIVEKFEKECGVKTSKSAVHRAIKELNFSYITPRPQHYKQEKNEQNEFKKN